MSKSFTNGLATTIQTSNGKEFNEFAQIEGLGPAMRRWLRESFAVQTLEDLAQLSVHRVLSHPTLSQLKDAEKAVCYRKLDRWVKQAQKFVAHETPWQTFTTYVVAMQSRQVGGQTEQRTTAYCLETGQSVTWLGIECNAVYEMMLDQLKQGCQLQPEVVNEMKPEEKHEAESIDAISPAEDIAPASEEVAPEAEIETKLQSQSEPIIEDALAADCVSESESISPEISLDIIEDASKSIPQSIELASAKEAEVEVEELSPVILEITEIKVWQPPKPEPSEAEIEEPEPRKTNPKKSISKRFRYEDPEEPEPEKSKVVNLERRSLPGFLKQAEPFDLEVTFQLTGSSAGDLTRKKASYNSEIYVREHMTRKTSSLGRSEGQTLVAEELTYTSHLKNLILQKPGSYRLQIITKLDGGQANPCFVELPFVQVM